MEAPQKMNRKMRIVVSGIFYPLSMMSYFIRALQRREDVELFTVGPFTGDYIPWNGGMHLPMRYVHTPSLPLPQNLIPLGTASPGIVQPRLPWEPDLWLQFYSGWGFVPRPKAACVALVQTDPHVIDPARIRSQVDLSFNMQSSYLRPGDAYLPYACDPLCHAPLEGVIKRFDACLVGLHYAQRDRLVNHLQSRGKKVYYGIGEVFDEFQQVYNQARVALNWSSLLDMNARTFEAFGMGIPLVTNRIPALNDFFVENEHYFGFQNEFEANTQVDKLLADPEMGKEMALKVRRLVLEKHTYDHRIQQIFERCGLTERKNDEQSQPG